MDPRRLKGLGYFALSATLWSYSPWLAATLGSNLSTLAIAYTALNGMWTFNESNVINSIRVCSD